MASPSVRLLSGRQVALMRKRYEELQAIADRWEEGVVAPHRQDKYFMEGLSACCYCDRDERRPSRHDCPQDCPVAAATVAKWGLR